MINEPSKEIRDEYANLKRKEMDLQKADGNGNLIPIDASELNVVRDQIKQLENQNPDLIF